MPAATASRPPSKINRAAKGAAIELKAIKLLELEGYTIHRCIRTGVRRGGLWISQSNDIFGCIDLVAKKRGERTRWIQVTSHSGVGQKKEDLAEVPWDPIHDSVEIWCWIGGARRKHKTTGAWLDRQYFQIYHLDDDYALVPERRIREPPEWNPEEDCTFGGEEE